MAKQINTLKSLLIASACLTLLIFTNCGGGSDDQVDAPELTAAERNAELLEGNWNLSSATNGGTPRDEWTGFTLSFSIDSDLKGGSYTASGIPSDEGADLVWSTSGTFTANSDLSVLTRNDGVVMTMVASATALNISFNINDSGGRMAGFTGDWVFSMRP